MLLWWGGWEAERVKGEVRLCDSALDELCLCVSSGGRFVMVIVFGVDELLKRPW